MFHSGSMSCGRGTQTCVNGSRARSVEQQIPDFRHIGRGTDNVRTPATVPRISHRRTLPSRCIRTAT